MRDKITIWVIVCFLIVSSLGVTKLTFAERKPRTVPPSATPIDGKKVALPTERKDITPEGAKTYKKYLNPTGTITLRIKPTVSGKTAPMNTNSVKSGMPVNYPALDDNIAFINTNGNVQSFSPPSLNFYAQNSQYTDPGPPPLPTIKQAETFAKYKWSGGMLEKTSILEAKLYCSYWTNGCTSDLDVEVHDVGTSWSSSSMTWSSRPSMSLSTLVTKLGFPTEGTANVLSSVQKANFTGTEIGFGFKIASANDTDCGISATDYPELEITYAPLEGGSPSGNDLSFGNGAGSMAIKWTIKVPIEVFLKMHQ